MTGVDVSGNTDNKLSRNKGGGHASPGFGPRTVSKAVTWPGRAPRLSPSNRYGWSTHFRSCVRMFCSLTFLAVSFSKASEIIKTTRKMDYRATLPSPEPHTFNHGHLKPCVTAQTGLDTCVKLPSHLFLLRRNNKP